MPHAFEFTTQIQRIKSNKKYISFHVSIWKTYIFLYTYIFAVFSSLKPTWECLKKLQIKKSKEVYRSKNGEFCNLVDLKLQKWRWFLNVVMVFQKKTFRLFFGSQFLFSFMSSPSTFSVLLKGIQQLYCSWKTTSIMKWEMFECWVNEKRKWILLGKLKVMWLKTLITRKVKKKI